MALVQISLVEHQNRAVLVVASREPGAGAQGACPVRLSQSVAAVLAVIGLAFGLRRLASALVRSGIIRY